MTATGSAAVALVGAVVVLVFLTGKDAAVVRSGAESQRETAGAHR